MADSIYKPIIDIGSTAQDGTNAETNKVMSKPVEKNYTEFRQFIGGMDSTNQNLSGFNPLMRGVARIHLYRKPVFMSMQYSKLTETFKQYMETSFRRVDGIGDLTVSFADFEGGFAPRRFSNPIQARDDTDTITISLYEQSGGLVKNFLELWISGVRDPITGLAHYHGLFDKPDIEIEYGEQNHTGEFIYYTLDPTGKRIEYSCMFAHAFPTRVQKGQYNYDSGQRDSVELDCEFNVVKYESKAINDIAYFYLANDIIKQKYLDTSYLEFSPYSKGGISSVKSQLGVA
jgi:hypothetical protein